MADIDIKCPISGCDYSTGCLPQAVAVVLLSTHAISHNQQPTTSRAASGPKLDRPKVSLGISMEDWNLFLRKWKVFLSGSGISEEFAPAQLFQCADDALSDSLLKVDPNITDQPLSIIMDMMKTLAVVPVAIGVIRADLLEMKQKRDEPFRAFASRVRGKAETCEFVASALCKCGQTNLVDYTDHMMRDVLIAGIYDPDIRREVLGLDGISTRPINDVVSLLEKKEMARDANLSRCGSSAVACGLNSNSQSSPQVSDPPPGFREPSASQKAQRATCTQCSTQFCSYFKGAKGWNTKPHAVCRDCFRHRRSRGKGESSSPAVSSIVSDSLDVVAQISSISSDVDAGETVVPQFVSPSHHPTSISPSHADVHHVKLDHHIFSSGEVASC